MLPQFAVAEIDPRGTSQVAYTVPATLSTILILKSGSRPVKLALVWVDEGSLFCDTACHPKNKLPDVGTV
jgi:hypothetical protein